jgi:hypothetical protein
LTRVCSDDPMVSLLHSAATTPMKSWDSSHFLIILSFDTDNFLAYELGGPISKLPHISFYLVVMKTPNPGDLMSHLTGKVSC